MKAVKYDPEHMTRMDVTELVDDLAARALALEEILEALGTLEHEVAHVTFDCLSAELMEMADDLGAISLTLSKGKSD